MRRRRRRPLDFRLASSAAERNASASAHAAMVKKAAALANTEMQLIPEDIGSAIVKACDDIIGGELQDQFVVDMIQGGAGTSTNMNANEGAKTPLFEPFIYTRHLFTKTGSGQT
jgi:aspartate ammonia-lyase